MQGKATAPVQASPAQPADARWAAVFAHVNGVIEGGARFVDDPSDSGGATKWGCSLRFLAGECKVDPELIDKFKIGHDGLVTVQDVRDLTQDQAEGVSRQCFWVDSNIQHLAQPLDAACYDLAYNDGIVPAVELLQQAYNAVLRAPAHLHVTVEGLLGVQSLTQINNLVLAGKGAQLLSTYRALAAQRYQAIADHDPSQHRFLAGWLSRAEHLGDV